MDEKHLTDLLIQYRGVQSSIENTRNTIKSIENKIQGLEYDRSVLQSCKPIIDDIINKFSTSMLKRLESLLTVGLKQIFYDRDYSVKIQVEERRNSKCVDMYLNDGGNLLPIKNANIAGGVIVVIAFILQVFFIINLGSCRKALFLDEQLSQVSSQYVEGLMSFIKTLCADTGLMIVLITHDNKFMKYGDRTYTADHGVFRLNESD